MRIEFLTAGDRVALANIPARTKRGFVGGVCVAIVSREITSQPTRGKKSDPDDSPVREKRKIGRGGSGQVRYWGGSDRI